MSSLDSWDYQTSGAIRLGHINGDTEINVGRVNSHWFAVYFVVVHVLAGQFAKGLNHGPGNQVGEGNFSTPGSAQMIVDDDPVINHQFGWHCADACRGRNLDALIHVGRQGFGHPTKGIHDIGALFRFVGVGKIYYRSGRGGCLGGNGSFFRLNRGGFCDRGGHRGGVIGG